jgi:hypothetical protein
MMALTYFLFCFCHFYCFSKFLFCSAFFNKFTLETTYFLLNSCIMVFGLVYSEIDVPVLGADVDMPVYWWDSEADKCLLVGVFKHGNFMLSLFK